MSIFISTGELSGDIYAAKLAAAIGKILPKEEIWGMGGALATGVNREWNNDCLHIMGLNGIVSALPKLFKLRNELAYAVVKRQPKVVIVVDSPDFHIPLLRKIRSLGYRGAAVYVCPPTVWAWRSGRAKYLRRYCDLCLPLFHFEEKVLKQYNVKSFWCGHPLIDDLANFKPTDNLLSEDPLRVALLPGSRRSEITSLLPVLEAAAVKLKERGLHPVFSVAPGLDDECKKMVIENRSGIEWTLTSGRNLMYLSKFVIGASGTASVEAMLLNKYMIVLYMGTKLEWFIYNLLTHTQFVSIPNVLAGYMMYPELLQEKAKLENVLDYADFYLSNKEYHDGIHNQIRLNLDMMGKPGAITRWAEAICSLVKK